MRVGGTQTLPVFCCIHSLSEYCSHDRALLTSLQELNRLDDEANVFKLIGPAMIKQDPVEAKSNVGKRLEYIKSDVDRLEVQIKTLETKLQAKQAEVRDRFRPSSELSQCKVLNFMHQPGCSVWMLLGATHCPIWIEKMQACTSVF